MGLHTPAAANGAEVPLAGYRRRTRTPGDRTLRGGPAFALSPAIEEGAQDAEFFVSTDAGDSSNNPHLSAWTNLSATASVAPRIRCMAVDMGVERLYDDPCPARQPGGGPISSIGIGSKQIYVKGARLYLAQTLMLDSGATSDDGIFWIEARPQLTSKAVANPQIIENLGVAQAGYVDYGPLFNAVVRRKGADAR
jgi:hypothetical protein